MRVSLRPWLPDIIVVITTKPQKVTLSKCGRAHPARDGEGAVANHYSALLLEVDRWETMDAAAEAVRALLRDRHRSGPKWPEDFQVQNRVLPASLHELS